MAKVNLTVVAQLTRSEMRKLNPHLRQKRLTIQEAVEKGLKNRIPTMYINVTAFLAAIEGLGIDLSKPTTNERRIS